MMNKMVVSTRVKPAKSNVQIPRPRFWRNATTIAQIITRKVKPQNIGCMANGRMRASSSALARELL